MNTPRLSVAEELFLLSMPEQGFRERYEAYLAANGLSHDPSRWRREGGDDDLCIMLGNGEVWFLPLPPKHALTFEPAAGRC